MSDPNEIPQMVTDLVDMSKEYLRQETLEPAKKLGRYAGVGIGVGVLMAVVALFFVLASYALFLQLLPESSWQVTLARVLTLVVAGAGVGILGMRIKRIVSD